MNAERHKAMLATFLWTELCPHQLDEPLTQQTSMQVLTSGHFKTDSFLILGKSPGPPTHVTLQYQTISFGANQKQHTWNTSFQQWWTKAANLEGHPMEMLPLMSAFPPRLQKCTEWHRSHQQSVIFKQRIQTNSHGHETHLIVSIKCFPLCLKTLICFKIS